MDNAARKKRGGGGQDTVSNLTGSGIEPVTSRIAKMFSNHYTIKAETSKNQIFAKLKMAERLYTSREKKGTGAMTNLPRLNQLLRITNPISKRRSPYLNTANNAGTNDKQNSTKKYNINLQQRNI